MWSDDQINEPLMARVSSIKADIIIPLDDVHRRLHLQILQDILHFRENILPRPLLEHHYSALQLHHAQQYNNKG